MKQYVWIIFQKITCYCLLSWIFPIISHASSIVINLMSMLSSVGGCFYTKTQPSLTVFVAQTHRIHVNGYFLPTWKPYLINHHVGKYTIHMDDTGHVVFFFPLHFFVGATWIVVEDLSPNLLTFNLNTIEVSMSWRITPLLKNNNMRPHCQQLG